MSEDTAPVKRARGRPRVHQSETTVISFRVPKKQAADITAFLSTIRLTERRVDDPDGDLLVDALEQRLRGLQNQQPQLIEEVLRSSRST